MGAVRHQAGLGKEEERRERWVHDRVHGVPVFWAQTPRQGEERKRKGERDS